MSTTTMSESKNITKQAVSGAIAGLGGGLLFGIMMAMMNFLPMVGMLVGQENSVIGFIVHMTISAVLGAIFGIAAGTFVKSTGTAVVAGIIYGAVWWVLGALILMPIMLGMNEMVLVIGQNQWLSLVGHLIYGVVAALLYIPLLNRI